MNLSPADFDLFKQLDELCYPESVAVVGASENLLKWGSFLMVSLLAGDFKGPIYPINPKAKSVLGVKAYPSLLECPGSIDLVFITVPQPLVLDVIRECEEKKVKSVVVITSGYSEVGGEGSKFEEELVAAVKKAGMRMIGPNTMGMISTHQNLFCTGSNALPPKGGISMISQSGNLGAQVVMWAEEQNVGINKFFGTGNEGDVSCTDLMLYLANDESTNAILAYLEGVDEGQRFLQAARMAAERKPVILLKSGRTDAGAKAAASHTGALSGSFEIFKGAMRQAGVILVPQPMDLIDGAACNYLPMPKGHNVCVVTLGGGWGVVASDLCNEYGLKLPDLPPDAIAQLDTILPSFWSRQNPVDLVGQIDPALYAKALEIVVASEQFDAVITLGLIGSSSLVSDTVSNAHRVAPESINEQMMMQMKAISDGFEESIHKDIARLTRQYGKPIINVSLDKRPHKLISNLGNGDYLVIFNTPEKVVRVLAGMVYYQKWRKSVGLPMM
ncbi:MAG TPA: CoA-binding protein [bacterium]|nr:CoA-binding protein [bacterium]